jgi:hypothetical protein
MAIGNVAQVELLEQREHAQRVIELVVMASSVLLTTAEDMFLRAPPTVVNTIPLGRLNSRPIHE